MTVVINILCGVMIAMSIFLVIAVLMQSGKDSRMSGTIAGGAETFFGKTKGKTIDRALSKATTIVSIIFVLMVLAVYVLSGIQANQEISNEGSSSSSTTQTTTEETDTTEAEETATGETTTGESQTGEGETQTGEGETENTTAE